MKINMQIVRFLWKATHARGPQFLEGEKYKN
jgi:hypothetical protein